MVESKNVVGILIVMFLGIVIVTALLPEIFNNQARMTNLIDDKANVTYTSFPADGLEVALTYCGQRVVSGYLYNATTPTIVAGGDLIPATNYTFVQRAGTDGYLTAYLNVTKGAAGQAGEPFNVSCEYAPKGYIEEGGGRSIAGLIGLFAVLALLAFCLYKWVEANGWMIGGF